MRPPLTKTNLLPPRSEQRHVATPTSSPGTRVVQRETNPSSRGVGGQLQQEIRNPPPRPVGAPHQRNSPPPLHTHPLLACPCDVREQPVMHAQLPHTCIIKGYLYPEVISLADTSWWHWHHLACCQPAIHTGIHMFCFFLVKVLQTHHHYAQ